MVKDKIKFNIWIILSFLILSIFSVSLLISTHQFMGFIDQVFHLRRIIELKTSILHGSLLPMFSFNQYHGSEIMTFYPYFNLYPIVLLSLFISSKIILMYLFFIINEFLSLICSYYGSYSYNRSQKISYLFSVCYSLSTMFITLGIDDFGEVTAMAALPLVIFGFLNMLKSDKAPYVKLVLGMTLIIYSHILTAIISCIFMAFWILLNLKRLNKYKIINIIKSALLIILLTTIVWIPVIWVELINHTKVYIPTPGIHNVKIINLFKVGLTNNTGNNLSILALGSILLSILLYWFMTSLLRKMLWISIIIVFVCSTDFPWGHVPKFVLNFYEAFQYPDRFFILAQLLLIYILSVNVVNILELFNKRWIKYIGYYGIIIFALIAQLDCQHIIKGWRMATPIISEQYFHKHIVGTKFKFWSPYRLSKSSQFKYVSDFNYSPTNDYYPESSIKKINLINNYYGMQNNENKIKLYHVGYNIFNFNNNKFDNSITLPFVIFNNRCLKLYLDGHIIKHYSNKYREPVINNINRGHHRLRIQYVPNMVFLIIKSILFLLGLIWLFSILMKNYKEDV